MTKEEQAQAKAREITREISGALVHGYIDESAITTALLSAERDGYRRGVQAFGPWVRHDLNCGIMLEAEIEPRCTCGLDAAKGGE